MAQSHAYLGVPSAHHTFKFNPNSVKWGYAENTASFDTIGGRVVQLLSVQVTDMTVEGVAGSRDELQKMAEDVRQIMDYHIRTLRPVHFRVPSRRWDFRVYVNAMPQMGWDVAAVTYPYQLTLNVEEDLTGIQAHKLESTVFDRLVDGIGYTPEFHGGDPEGFNKIVKSVLAASAGVEQDTGTNNNTPTETAAARLAPQGTADGTVQLRTALSILRNIRGWNIIGICGSGSIPTSEHRYCNAADIGGSLDVLNEVQETLVKAGKEGSAPIHCVIGPDPRWSLGTIQSRENGWVAHEYGGPNTHQNHVHVSGWPSVGGSC